MSINTAAAMNGVPVTQEDDNDSGHEEEERSDHDTDDDYEDGELEDVLGSSPNEKQNRIRRSEDNRSKHQARDVSIR